MKHKKSEGQYNNIISVILAAGKGSRMKSELPKFEHKVGNFKLIEHVVYKAKMMLSKQIVIVTSPNFESYLNHLNEEVDIVFQKNSNGTGGAVLAALSNIENSNSEVVFIFYCDTPLISINALNQMLDIIYNNEVDISVLGFYENNINSYGKLIVDENNNVREIIEAKDYKDNNIHLCNSGVIALKSSIVQQLLYEIDNKNSAKEFYLTDIVKIAGKKGLKTKVVIEEEGSAKGINNKKELSEAERYFQNLKREEFLEQGVTLVDPSTAYFSLDTKIGKNVIINPSVVIGREVIIEDNVVIEAFSQIEKTIIKKSSNIGPFARIRENTIIGEDSIIGNFVEIKKSKLSEKVRVMHLSYIGDSEIGERSNIGAGVITCNFDGKNKHNTKIGKDCFIGSNSSLIAPIELENEVYIGAGSVITKDVKEKNFAVARSRQIEIKNWKNKNENNN